MATRSTQAHASVGRVAFALLPPAKRRRRPAAGASVKSESIGTDDGAFDLAFSVECVPRIVPTVDDARQLAAEHAAELDEERGVAGLFEWLQLDSNLIKLEPLSSSSSSSSSSLKLAAADRVLDSSRSHLDKEVAFVLHLRPHHFSINNQTTQHVYTHATNALLEAIDAGRLPPDVQDMLEDIPCPFYDGGVVVELYDYRGLAPADVQQVSFNGEGVAPRVRRVLLKPDNESIVDDVNRLWNGHKVAYPQWGPEQYVAIEQRLVHAIAPPLCLNPSPLVGRALAVLHYNRLKMNYRAPDQLRPAMAERSTRRSLTYFLVARNAATHVPPAGLLSLPPPVPGVLPAAQLSPTPGAIAAEAHARVLSHLSRAITDALPPNIAPPPTLALVTNKRQLKLQGDVSSMYLKAVENPCGSYEGLIRITELDDPAAADETVRFSLGSLNEAVSFISQVRALCKRREAYTVALDSGMPQQAPAGAAATAAAATAAATAQHQQQQPVAQKPPPNIGAGAAAEDMQVDSH
jgi:hypothetical protein